MKCPVCSLTKRKLVTKFDFRKMRDVTYLSISLATKRKNLRRFHPFLWLPVVKSYLQHADIAVDFDVLF